MYKHQLSKSQVISEKKDEKQMKLKQIRRDSGDVDSAWNKGSLHRQHCGNSVYSSKQDYKVGLLTYSGFPHFPCKP